MRYPYLTFYPRDWLGEYRLRMLSPADRGVWIDLLCLMAMADPYGHLAIMGKPMTDLQVAAIIGIDEATYKGHVSRLESTGVFSRNECGMIYSRRMVKDYERIKAGSKWGRKGGGNPALRTKKNPDSITHTPYSRETIKVGYKGADSSQDAEFQEFWGLYPRKKAKKTALIAWMKARQSTEFGVLIDALKKQKTWPDWIKDGGAFIPHPATWLNGRRWEDEPSTMAYSKPRDWRGDMSTVPSLDDPLP